MLQRTITALVLVAVVLYCIFATATSVPMFILMIFTAGVAGYEWFKLMPKQLETPLKRNKAQVYGLFIAAMSGLALWYQEVALLLWCASFFIWLISLYWVKAYPHYDAWYNPSLYLAGVVLLTAAVTAIFQIWSASPWWLMFMFALVWGADTGAYVFGRKFGKTQLAPTVSPNKSVEGLIGGVVTSVLIIAVIEYFYLNINFQQKILFTIAAVLTVLASVQGDLFESMLKRRAGLKDSGRVLPGHGGVLDRIDSLLAAAPIFAIGMFVLKLLGVDL